MIRRFFCQYWWCLSAAILKDANALSSDDLKERILHEVRTFAAGESPHDDMTLVIVKVV